MLHYNKIDKDKNSCIQCDSPMESLLVKLREFFTPKRTFEIRGTRFKLADFWIRPGIVTSSGSNKCVTIEIEYTPSVSLCLQKFPVCFNSVFCWRLLAVVFRAWIVYFKSTNWWKAPDMNGLLNFYKRFFLNIIFTNFLNMNKITENAYFTRNQTRCQQS